MKDTQRLTLGIGCLVVFVVLGALILSGATQRPDASLARAMNASLGSYVTTLMVLASEYGREYFWIGLVALMLIFGSRDVKLLAVELAALFVIGIIAGEVMKYIVYRPRPFITLSSEIVTRVTPDTDSSFPSGHAIIVSIGAVFALARFKRKWVAWLLILEAAIVCYSRVYVGMHYPLDVVSGVFLGASIVFIGMYFLEKYLGRYLGSLAWSIDRALRSAGIPEYG